MDPLPPDPLYSVVIPAHNEEANLGPTVTELADLFRAEGIRYEIVVVNDNSSDGTGRVAAELSASDPGIRVVTRTRLGGFGRAIRAGLQVFEGDAVAIVMADRSDDPQDVVRYLRGEPVRARRATLRYRLWKWSLRNKRAVAPWTRSSARTTSSSSMRSRRTWLRSGRSRK